MKRLTCLKENLTMNKYDITKPGKYQVVNGDDTYTVDIADDKGELWVFFGASAGWLKLDKILPTVKFTLIKGC